MMTINIIFIILMLYCMKCEAAEEDDLIDFYENVIRTGINESSHFTLPTSAESHRPKDDCEEKDIGTYDFIVIGSGPGGSVVANRLTEVKEWNVLLLEAGIPESNFSIIPAMKFYLANSKFSWGFQTTKQKNSCLARPSNKCSVPKGKAMGGTTAINGLIYSRGHKTDYERWAQEGNSGWSFAEVLPYFIKSENSEIDGDPGYHGKGGYMNVMYHRPHSDRCEAFLKGNRELFPILNGKDYNGKQEFGAFYSQFNKIKKFRQSSSKAFLEPIMDRPNLKILNGSYVTKILIDPRTKTAYGVTFTKDGKCFTANASKEVILSAGVINSPQILMLSGVGPRPHLSKLKIPVIQDLPVGKSLYQHSLFYGAFMNTNSTAPVQSLRESVKQFLDDYGPLTIPANNEGVGFYRTLSERSNSPDVELAINPSGEFYIFEQASRYTDEVRHALFDKLNRNTFIHTYIYLLKPESVGSITLESSDPFKYPLIDSNCLNKTKDIKVLLTGIRILERLMYTKPFRKINATMVYADYPQCKKYPLGSNNYWVCALKLLTDPGAHQMCSCRMGPNPNTSVVGSRGNVHGIKRLRVVDASIIPFSVAGHPAAPIFMLAEKISDYIKLDYGKPIDPITNVID